MLSITPVKRIRTPRYPDADDIRKKPSLLYCMPKRFSVKPAVCAALSATMALGLTGCMTQKPTEQLTPEGKSTTDAPISTEEPTAPTGTEQPPAGLMIPVFAYGEGRGSFGCESVAPAVFLSEDEALQVIRDEAAVYGVTVTDGTTVQADVPYTDLFSFLDDRPDPGFKNRELVTDATIEGTDISIEYISTGDVVDWYKETDGMTASVEIYDTRDTAERLAAANTNIAAFYDPMSADYADFDFQWTENTTAEDWDAAYAEFDKVQREKSLEQVRNQVRSFFEWLKGQGII